MRRHWILALLVVAAFVLTTGPAGAAPPAKPLPGLPAPGSGHHIGRSGGVSWAFGPSSPFGGTRFDGEYVESLNRVYFLGFRTFGDATDGSVWYYDVGSEAYVDTGVDMMAPVSNYGIAALDDGSGRLGLYIFGGRDATPTAIDTVQVFYPDTASAQVIPTDPFPGRTPSGCIPLTAMGTAVLENKAYVLGGMGFSSLGCVDENSAQTWIFDPTAPAGSRWAPGPDLNLARGYVTSAVLNGEIYAIGGDTNSAGTLTAVATVEKWAPPSGGWDDSGVADLPQPCDESQAFPAESGSLGPGIVLAGCGQWPNATPATYHYMADTNKWCLAGFLNDNRRNHAGAAFTVGSQDTMFILGGYGEDSVFIDPIDTSELGTAAPFVVPRYRCQLGGGGRSLQLMPSTN